MSSSKTVNFNADILNLVIFFRSRDFCKKGCDAGILAGYAAQTVTADSSKQGCQRAVALPPDLSKDGQWGQWCLFHNSTIGNCMVYQDRTETNFL